jgi:hypothetical protein
MMSAKDFYDVKDQTEWYTLSTCSRKTEMSGRKAKGFVIHSVKGNCKMDLPPVIECVGIHYNRLRYQYLVLSKTTHICRK